MKITIPNLDYFADSFQRLAELDKRISKTTKKYLQKEGFLIPRAFAGYCMSWVWYQWLLEGKVLEIRERVESFVSRGLKMRELSSIHCMRSIHDLYLLHCAIFACSDELLRKVAERVEIATANMSETSPNHGERYAAACCGMLKYRILGEEKIIAKQYELAWNSYRAPSFRGAPKPLMTAWVKNDWVTFTKLQGKDFERLWARARKYRVVRKSTKQETTVVLGMFPVEDVWCWAHCGMALLAYRQFGVQVATDPLWFPPYALKVVPTSK